MSRPTRLMIFLVAVGAVAVELPAQTTTDHPDVVATPALVTSSTPFIGITPCRIADTRDASFPPGYGPPALSPGVANGRTFALTGQCGIPVGAVAVSLNVTVVNTLGVGYIVLYPQDGAFPPVSTLNYSANQTVANAAVVPLGTNGSIRVVAGVSGTDLILDTNGYYAGSATANGNTSLGVASPFETTGFDNTSMGSNALYEETTGGGNTAIGQEALINHTSGTFNTALGTSALFFTHAGGNTALGFDALVSAPGSRNIALGEFAGMDLTSGDDNILIGTFNSPASESATTRIGDFSIQAAAFIAGVRGVTVGAGALPVLVDSTAQLGTVSSSARFKEGVRDMDEASSGLLNLRPVTFRYKGQAGGRRQFGLIAEEVEEVLPDLVVCDSDGEAETVLYHEMPAMLLQELQRQQRRIEELRGRLAELESRRRLSTQTSSTSR